MTIDVNRYALLINEFRYATVNLPAIGNVYAKAQELEIDSKFATMVGIPALANALTAVVGSPKRRIEVTITGTDTLTVDSFINRTPVVYVLCMDLSIDGNFIVTRVVVNEDDNLTIFEGWGG